MPHVPFVLGPCGAIQPFRAIDRGSGILNIETYIGRIVFNRSHFRKTRRSNSPERA